MSNLIISIPIVGLIIYWIGAFFIVYHLIKYGITTWPRKIAGAFLAVSIVLSLLCFMLFTQIDWKKMSGNTTVQINNSGSNVAKLVTPTNSIK